MKRKSTLIILSLTLIVAFGLSSFEIFKHDGAPAGNTGSPADASTCASCHGGTAQAVSGWITTNIPAEGYTPGQVYQITCTNNLTNMGKYGFQCSPQDINGGLLGTLTAGTNNKLTGLNKYVTHTDATTTDNTWTFSWTAPAANVGTVTFYAAFAKGQPGVASVAKTSLTVTKASGVGIASAELQKNLTVFPNPSQGRFQLANMGDQVEDVAIYSNTGKLVYHAQGDETKADKLDIDLGNQAAGIYHLKISSQGEEVSRKLVIR